MYFFCVLAQPVARYLLRKEVNMKLGFHGATTMTADLQTDVATTAHAGFQTLELWAAKVDRFLTRLKGTGYNSPCSIELFRPEYWEWDSMQLAVKAREATVKVMLPTLR